MTVDNFPLAIPLEQAESGSHRNVNPFSVLTASLQPVEAVTKGSRSLGVDNQLFHRNPWTVFKRIQPRLGLGNVSRRFGWQLQWTGHFESDQAAIQKLICSHRISTPKRVNPQL